MTNILEDGEGRKDSKRLIIERVECMK